LHVSAAANSPVCTRWVCRRIRNTSMLDIVYSGRIQRVAFAARQAFQPRDRHLTFAVTCGTGCTALHAPPHVRLAPPPAHACTFPTHCTCHATTPLPFNIQTGVVGSVAGTRGMTPGAGRLPYCYATCLRTCEAPSANFPLHTPVCFSPHAHLHTHAVTFRGRMGPFALPSHPTTFHHHTHTHGSPLRALNTPGVSTALSFPGGL